MSLLQRICKGPLMWWLILLALATQCPLKGASEGAEDPVPNSMIHAVPTVDFSPLKEVVRIAGTFSVAVALVWTSGIILAARTQRKERHLQCGER